MQILIGILLFILFIATVVGFLLEMWILAIVGLMGLVVNLLVFLCIQAYVSNG